MTQTETQPQPLPAATPFVVIAGFGLPGRALADLLRQAGVQFAVIDSNSRTTGRLCEAMQIVCGDARQAEVLKSAGIERATLFAAMMPDENCVLAAVNQVRQINPAARIVARCHYTSTGLKAIQGGASDVVVEEQVVAREVERLICGILGIS